MLRVVEVYASFQGEGPNTSMPTVFVRFAGCNFKCPGWPCDTQHAIDPKIFSKIQALYSPIALAQHVLDFGINNVCLTGGEVFLQNNNDLKVFIEELKSNKATTIEIFTNGSLPWGEAIPMMVDSFIVDWKLPGSGEDYQDTWQTLQANFENLNILDAIKFTIADENDYIIAKQRYNVDILGMEPTPLVYAGVVWNGSVTTEELCQWMLDDNLPWHLNVQVHKFIWSPDRIGV